MVACGFTSPATVGRSASGVMCSPSASAQSRMRPWPGRPARRPTRRRPGICSAWPSATSRSRAWPPKFTDTRLAKAIGEPMIQMVTAQELRLNLGDDSFTGDIDDAIEEIRRDFMKPEIECVMETVAPDGSIIDHFDGRTLNPAMRSSAPGLSFGRPSSAERSGPDPYRLPDSGLDVGKGWDGEHGGLFYFRDVYDKPVQEYWHDMKFWWPHNEAIIASLLALSLTGEEKYAPCFWCTIGHMPVLLTKSMGSGTVTFTVTAAFRAAEGQSWKGPFICRACSWFAGS